MQGTALDLTNKTPKNFYGTHLGIFTHLIILNIQGLQINFKC